MSASSAKDSGATVAGLRPSVWLFLGVVAAFLIGFIVQKSRRPLVEPTGEAETPVVESSPPEESRPMPSAPIASLPPVAGSSLESEGGMRVLRARLTGAGASVELTYTIVDVEKAKNLSLKDSEASLVILSNGTRLGVGNGADLPKGLSPHARMHSVMLANQQGWGFPPIPGRMVKDKVYLTLIPNLRNAVVAGSECVLECGGHQSAHLIVEGEESKP
jgi:hypothetical protein